MPFVRIDALRADQGGRSGSCSGVTASSSAGLNGWSAASSASNTWRQRSGTGTGPGPARRAGSAGLQPASCWGLGTRPQHGAQAPARAGQGGRLGPGCPGQGGG
jgi:hypothetical protein